MKEAYFFNRFCTGRICGNRPAFWGLKVHFLRKNGVKMGRRVYWKVTMRNLQVIDCV